MTRGEESGEQEKRREERREERRRREREERREERRGETRRGTGSGGRGERAFIIAARFCHTPGARARNSALPGIANTNFGTRQRRPKFTNEISELAGKMWDRAARSISRKISGGQQEREIKCIYVHYVGEDTERERERESELEGW